MAPGPATAHGQTCPLFGWTAGAQNRGIKPFQLSGAGGGTCTCRPLLSRGIILRQGALRLLSVARA